MKKVTLNNKILILGCGAVAQCVLSLLQRHISLAPHNLVFLDSQKTPRYLADLLAAGAQFHQVKLTKNNYRTILNKLVSRGDIIIDLTFDVSTADLLEFCFEHHIRYINTAVYDWPSIKKEWKDATIGSMMQKIKRVTGTFDNHAPTMLVSHGMNPGLVSHFVKYALDDIAQHILQKEVDRTLETLLEENNDKGLAQYLGLKIIQITEKDTQGVPFKRKSNEFVNTWSVVGLYEEAIGPIELGWGTHEQSIPHGATFLSSESNQIYIQKRGMDSYGKSWTPCEGPFNGMLIPHEEIITISDYFTIKVDNKPVYRPTVYFVYEPTEIACASLAACRENKYELLQKHRIIKREIITGNDQVGVLLMGHPLNAWWTGSVLDINQVRALVPHENATTLQVAAGVLSALVWSIENPQKGYLLPDELPHRGIMEIAKPYLGTIISQQIDWPHKTKKAYAPNYQWLFQAFSKDL